MKAAARWLVRAAGVVFAFGCSDATSPNGAIDRPIVFIGRRTVLGQEPMPEIAIYSIHVDGSGLRRLSTGAGQALHPAWSRDGQQIAFSSGQTGGTELWAMAADGSNARRLSSKFPTCVYTYEGLTWDPSGNRLAAECFWNVAIFDLRSETVTAVSKGLEDSMENPNWSPDGARLAFSDPFEPDVFVQAVDGGTRSRLIPDGADPAWSPDGRQVAFTGKSVPGIHVANVDGTGRARLTSPQTVGVDDGPTWSPDGRWISFHRAVQVCVPPESPSRVCSMTWGVFVMRADGSELRRITPDSLDATRPAW